MRDRTCVEQLEMLVRECPHVMRAFAGRGLEESMRAARIAAGMPLPASTALGIVELVPARTGDPRAEPGEVTRVPRERRSSAPVLAAQAMGLQHFVKAREHLDRGIAEVGEAAKLALAIDDAPKR